MAFHGRWNAFLDEMLIFALPWMAVLLSKQVEFMAFHSILQPRLIPTTGPSTYSTCIMFDMHGLTIVLPNSMQIAYNRLEKGAVPRTTNAYFWLIQYSYRVNFEHMVMWCAISECSPKSLHYFNGTTQHKFICNCFILGKPTLFIKADHENVLKTCSFDVQLLH